MYGTGLSGGLGGGNLFNQPTSLGAGGGLGPGGLGNAGGLGGGLGNMGTGLGGGGLGPGIGGGGMGTGLGGGGLGGNLGGGGLGGGGGLFPSSSAASAGLFTGGLQGGGVAGLGGGAGGSGLFNQTPHSQSQLFSGGTGLGGLGTGLGGGGATGLGMGGVGNNLFQSPISSAAGLGAAGGLTGNRGLFNQSSGLGVGGLGGGAGGLGGGAGGLGGGAFSTPLFNRTSAAGTGTGGLGLGGGGMGLGLGGGIGMGGMMGGGINNIGTPVAYNPTKGNDCMIKNGQSMNIYTNLNCVTGMKQYENKSLEELRFEDYSCNRKGPGGAGGMLVSQAGGGMMGGATSTAAGLFSGGGLGGGGLGGGGGLFNTGTSGASGMFSTTKPSLFPTSKSATGLGLGGGGQLGGGLFNPTSQQSGLGAGLMGGTSTGLFAGGAGGLGGTGLGQAQLGGGLKPTGLGGGTGLGLGGGLGGGLGATGGLGGTAGLGGTGVGLGGQAGGLGGGMLNRPLGVGLGTGIGGAQTGQLGAGTGIGMGLGGGGLGLGNTTGLGTTLKPGGLGMGNTAGGLGGYSGGGLGLGGTAQTGLNMNQNPLQNLTMQQQQAQLQQQIQLLASSPFGDSPLFRTAMSDSEKTKRNKSSTPVSSKLPPSSVSSASPHYKLNVKPSNKFRTISLNTPSSSSSSSSSQRKEKSAAVFEGLNDSLPSGESFVPRQSIKKLNFNPKPRDTPTHLSSASLATPTTASPPAVSTVVGTPPVVTKPAFTVTPVVTSSVKRNESLSSPEVSFALAGNRTMHKPTPRRPLSAVTPNDTMTELGGGGGGDQSVTSTTPPYVASLSSPTPSQTQPISLPLPPPPPPPPPLSSAPKGFILTKEGYYSRPPVNEIKRRLDDGQPVVQDLVIGRSRFGEVLFTGDTDVSDINIDELVSINLKEVSVYPDDSVKPPQGEGLNKRAVISLSGYWPVCKTTRQPIKDPQKLADLGYIGKLRSSTAKIGARFCDYHPETGTCVFEVDHFSKYKLKDDDDDDDDDETGSGGKAKKSTTVPVHKKPKTTASTGVTTAVTTTTTATATTANPKVLLPLPKSTATVKTGQTGLLKPLVVAKQPVTLDDVSDEEEEEEGEGEEMQCEVSSTMTPSRHLATTLGLCTDRLQVMKASFFSDQENVPRLGGHAHSGTASYFDKGPAHFNGKSRLALKPLSAPKSHLIPPSPPRVVRLPLSKGFSHFPVDTSPVLSSLSEAPPTRTIYLPSEAPPIAPPTSLSVVRQKVDRLVPLDESVLSGRTHFHRDAGAFLGRSFRVGWGRGWTLAHVGHPISDSGEGVAPVVPHSLFPVTVGGHTPSHSHSSGYSHSIVSIEKVDASPWMKEGLLDTPTDLESIYEPFLRVQLVHSCIGAEKAEEEGAELMSPDEERESHEVVPLITPVNPQLLMEEIVNTCNLPTDESEPEFKKQFSDVFNLVTALWGQLVEAKEEEEEEEESIYWTMAERKRRLSKWFQNVLKEEEEDEENLFNLLCQFRLTEAVTLAHSLNSHRLALIIAQASNPNLSLRLLLQQQLDEWNRLEADEHINPSIHSVYVLLSGLLVWEGRDKSVNLCEGLNWREAAALHLWYTLAPTDSVTDFIDKYDKAFESDDPYSATPVPLYMASSSPGSAPSLSPENSLCDTSYHLMKLFNRRDYPLEEVLTPSGSTPYQLDYRLSWHLWSLLSALGYSHTSHPFLLSLHASFSAQLEAAGLWEWAVFVAMHVQSAPDRKQLVEEVLYRHCDCEVEGEGELSDKEVFIIEELLVPQECVYTAKAQSAECKGLYELQASYLLKARQWDRAHQVVIGHVAPEAIVSNNLDLLLHSLEVLSQPDHCSLIRNWDSQGLVYLDYLRVSEKVDELSNADSVSLEQLIEVHALLECVVSRVSSLSGETPLECLCQIEIAKKMATLMRIVVMLKYELSLNQSVDDHFLFPSLSSLPVPQEHRHFELRQFASSLPLPPASTADY